MRLSEARTRSVAQRKVEKLVSLTSRQVDILYWMSLGLVAVEVGLHLGVMPQVIHSELRKAREATGAKATEELIFWMGYRLGLRNAHPVEKRGNIILCTNSGLEVGKCTCPQCIPNER